MTDDELREALDGLFAYDTGAVSSGIHDEALRARCIAELKRRSQGTDGAADSGFRLWEARLLRGMFLDEDALEAGYGAEDLVEFVRWLDDRMDYSIGPL